MKSYPAQFAIRSAAEGVHVQVTASSDLFHNGYTRSYGAAFNVRNESLTAAVKQNAPTLPSKAGTSRKYVGGKVVFGEDGAIFTISIPAPRVSKVLAASLIKASEVNIEVSDSQIRE